MRLPLTEDECYKKLYGELIYSVPHYGRFIEKCKGMARWFSRKELVRLF